MVDIYLLFTSLEAIERICMQEKANTQSGKKVSNRARKATSDLVLNLQLESQRKLAPRSIGTYTRSVGTRLLCTIRETIVRMRKTKRRNPISMPPRKAERYPTRIFCVQLSKKLDKLEKALKKSSLKSKKRHYKDSDSNSE